MVLGAKLRSEKLDQYDALGERGQPLYQAAAQILTTLGRQRPELAAHFAVPQLSSDGTVIDWYAPAEGAVVPWNAATESERVAASSALEELTQKLATFRECRLQDDNGGSLFVQMLRWVPEYPDSSHVYIVGGKPVLTFWGFQSRSGSGHLPLHAVPPDTSGEKIRVPVRDAISIEEPQEPIRSMNESPSPVQSVPTPVLVQPWWKRWWLWLLLLLLLLALLFGLRSCVPRGGATPAWTGFSWPWSGRPAMDLGAPNMALPNLPRVAGGAATGGLPTAAVETSGYPAGGPTGLPTPAADLAPDAAASLDGAPVADALPDLDPASGTHPEVSPPGLPQTEDGPAGIPPQLANAQPAGEPLVIPADQADGAVDFLNGDWGVRAGIQDRNTGQPLRLHYSFQDGQGQVTLARHNGVVCQAPVSAAMSAGALAITNQSDAVCSDGQTFAMPAIQCSPSQAQAACQGQYGDDYFPLTMRQTQP